MRLIWVFLFFLCWGALLTPVSIVLANRYGMMDYPDKRKIHHGAVPRGGGLTLWSGLLLWALLFAEGSFPLRIVMTGGTVVFFAGYMDDMFPLSPFGRLAVQFCAAALALLSVGKLDVLRMGLLLFWTAGVTNAYNFIDGMNGLALSMAFLSVGFIGWMWSLVPAVPALGLMIGIFFWNFPNAKTFLGDGGAYLLGYFTASLAMEWLVPMQMGFFKLCIALLLVGGVPVMDTLCAIIRRLAHGKSPFYPDRGHLHHRLLDKGLSTPEALAILFVLQMISLCGAYFFLK